MCTITECTWKVIVYCLYLPIILISICLRDIFNLCLPVIGYENMSPWVAPHISNTFWMNSYAISHFLSQYQYSKLQWINRGLSPQLYNIGSLGSGEGECMHSAWLLMWRHNDVTRCPLWPRQPRSLECALLVLWFSHEMGKCVWHVSDNANQDKAKHWWNAVLKNSS